MLGASASLLLLLPAALLLLPPLLRLHYKVSSQKFRQRRRTRWIEKLLTGVWRKKRTRGNLCRQSIIAWVAVVAMRVAEQQRQSDDG